MWITARVMPIASPAKPAGAFGPVEPRTTSVKSAVITTSNVAAAASGKPPL